MEVAGGRKTLRCPAGEAGISRSASYARPNLVDRLLPSEFIFHAIDDRGPCVALGLA